VLKQDGYLGYGDDASLPMV